MAYAIKVKSLTHQEYIQHDPSGMYGQPKLGSINGAELFPNKAFAEASLKNIQRFFWTVLNCKETAVVEVAKTSSGWGEVVPAGTYDRSRQQQRQRSAAEQILGGLFDVLGGAMKL